MRFYVDGRSGALSSLQILGSGGCARRDHHAEAEKWPAHSRWREIARGAAVAYGVDHPCPAARRMRGPGRGPLRIALGRMLIIIRTPKVRTPRIGIADHVVQPEGVGLEPPHRRG